MALDGPAAADAHRFVDQLWNFVCANAGSDSEVTSLEYHPGATTSGAGCLPAISISHPAKGQPTSGDSFLAVADGMAVGPGRVGTETEWRHVEMLTEQRVKIRGGKVGPALHDGPDLPRHVGERDVVAVAGRAPTDHGPASSFGFAPRG